MNLCQKFVDKFCQRYQCPHPDFAEAVLWRCLPPGRTFLAKIIWWCEPDLFLSDLYLINEVANAQTVEEVRRIIQFSKKEPATRSFIRLRLKVRLSRSKLLALAESVLGESISA